MGLPATSTPEQGHAAESVRLIRTGDVILVEPGKLNAKEVPRNAIQRHGYFNLMRQNDGSFLPVLNTFGTSIRLSESFCRSIGIDLSYDTMRRLANSRFVASRRVAPNTILIDLESLHEHFEACKDPEFWTPERILRYNRQSRIKSKKQPVGTNKPKPASEPAQAPAKRGGRPS